MKVKSISFINENAVRVVLTFRKDLNNKNAEIFNNSFD